AARGRRDRRAAALSEGDLAALERGGSLPAGRAFLGRRRHGGNRTATPRRWRNGCRDAGLRARRWGWRRHGGTPATRWGDDHGDGGHGAARRSPTATPRRRDRGRERPGPAPARSGGW